MSTTATPSALARLAGASLVLLAVGCGAARSAAEPITDPPTTDERDALEPVRALEVLKEGNRRFVSGDELPRDWKALVENCAGGANPLAAVLTTTDARVLVPRAFDLGVGDVVQARTLGAVPTDAAVAALERAVVVDGAKEIVVLVHGDCAELHDAYLGQADALPAPGAALVQGAKRAVGPDVQPLGGALSDASLEDVVTIELGKQILRDVLKRSAPLREAVEGGRIGTAVGYYQMTTGAIAWFDAGAGAPVVATQD
ncbi:MAG: carbonic anhydrase [Planctomycetota bacterium]